jgi:hypothetical protein
MAKKYLIATFQGDEIQGPIQYSPPFQTPMPQIEMQLMEKGIQIAWMDVTNKTPDEIESIKFLDLARKKKSGEVKI